MKVRSEGFESRRWLLMVALLALFAAAGLWRLQAVFADGSKPLERSRGEQTSPVSNPAADTTNDDAKQKQENKADDRGLSAEFDWRKAAPSDDAVLAVVDGEPLRIGDYKNYLLGQFGDGYVEIFINEHLVEREAKKRGVVATDRALLAWIEDKVRQSQAIPEFAGMDWDELRRRYRPHARMGYLIETLVKQRRTSPEGLRREYALRFGEKRRARHILYQVRVRPGMPENKMRAIEKAQFERAQAAVERLRHGADFAELARRESEDPASAARGGELPPFSRFEMVEGFAKAAFAMKVGEISDPVRSEYGWHVIELLEVIPASEPWGPEIEARLKAEAFARPVDKMEINALLEGLRKAAKIERVWTPGG